ncbi:c-type cytochrome biogenesis protein CcsB [Evansella cellulosilytica]|uniref:Cytochrome c-type biogenesis protein CcsB n=1 Tax=Evansella cellulosilytica (strain ATCC 21833 / DSM 2522 / FERM P-1141 / JCM 9156 / N-4) TaxID=649639 RepID=E6TYN5_EVAC2|nr:c-type cytochrome biogenesis protein CcsB [Evansella cellulosilytica]ADU30085.1 cytochrome c-type biogenesis protein CcsB [Evansella cellulosilytica DSM 2522]
MIEWSSNFLYISFFMFLASTIFYSVSVTGRKFKDREGNEKNRSSFFGYIFAVLGTLAAVVYFILRWIAIEHAPVSNMFEYTTFLGISMALAFIVIYPMYKMKYLGVISMPIVMLIIAYASMFPSDVQPLIPALQSHWLTIHVITVSLGQGILAIGFAGGLLYLLRVVDFKVKSKKVKGVEFILFTLLCTVAYISLGMGFGAAGYEAQFNYIDERGNENVMVYNKPALVGPNKAELVTEDRMSPLLNTPAIIRSDDLNTVLWSIIGGLFLYIVLRLILRKPIGGAIQPLLKQVNPQTVDELSYRAIAIGFPVFTLGGLIFAMIWAQIAWTRFWGWDPKEVWALITFLFYAAYLHLRLSKGWHGEKSAWLCVIGFAIIMFNLIFVNLVIAGLHSYA